MDSKYVDDLIDEDEIPELTATDFADFKPFSQLPADLQSFLLKIKDATLSPEIQLRPTSGTSEQYFEPFIGDRYEMSKCKTLLISESTYDWLGDDGLIHSPGTTHAEDSVKYQMEHFKQNRYFTAINRAMTGKAEPTEDEMRTAWNEFAYSIFVQKTVGAAARMRPSDAQWQGAANLLLPLLEKLRPERVIVTGIEMWKHMPDTKVQLSGDVQAYELRNGDLVWCLAVPHPANTVSGFQWWNVARYIRTFRRISLPQNVASMDILAAA